MPTTTKPGEGRSDRSLRLEDAGLAIGLPVQITVHQSEREYPSSSVLIGYVVGQVVLIKMPDDVGVADRLQLGDRLAVRMFSGLEVLSFESTVKQVFRDPYPYLHLSYPPELTATRLRVSHRVLTRLEARVTAGSSTERPVPVLITDLGVRGASFTASEALGVMGARLRLRFTLPMPGSTEGVAVDTWAAIQSAKPAIEGGISHGLSFGELMDKESLALRSYVYETLVSTPSRKA